MPATVIDVLADLEQHIAMRSIYGRESVSTKDVMLYCMLMDHFNNQETQVNTTEHNQLMKAQNKLDLIRNVKRHLIFYFREQQEREVVYWKDIEAILSGRKTNDDS